MWLRIPLAALAAIATMGAVYAIMYRLIQSNVDVETTPVTRIDFTRLKIDSEVTSTRTVKPQRKETAPVPNTPKLQIASGVSNSGAPVKIEGIGVGDGIKLAPVSMSGFGGVDREVIPLVRIQPQYPPRAASRGIEGWVRVQFNITPSGSVIDATVSDSEPRGMFDRAALEAVSRWKYNPKVEGGVAVERRGVQVLLTFQLEK